jgi:hypothetical protein
LLESKLREIIIYFRPETVTKHRQNKRQNVTKGEDMKIYVCGKLNDCAVGYLKNVHNMIKAGNQLRKLGHSVYIPCLDMLSGIMDGNMEYEDYFDNNLPWLECADALFILPDSQYSKGTLKEIEHAEILGIPVYFNVKEILQ